MVIHLSFSGRGGKRRKNYKSTLRNNGRNFSKVCKRQKNLYPVFQRPRTVLNSKVQQILVEIWQQLPTAVALLPAGRSKAEDSP